MKSFYLCIFAILLSIISCKTIPEKMLDFTKCAKNQIGKPYVTYDSRGPKSFSNSGLVQYCRKEAGLSVSSTIYISWKIVKEPIVGSHVFGIMSDTESSVSGDCLGIIVSVNPTIIVTGDEEKKVLVSKKFNPDPKYKRNEYIYIDFQKK